jgi:hypothetical protein
MTARQIEVSVLCMHSSTAIRSDQWRASSEPSTWGEVLDQFLEPWRHQTLTPWAWTGSPDNPSAASAASAIAPAIGEASACEASEHAPRNAQVIGSIPIGGSVGIPAGQRFIFSDLA